MCQRKKSPLNQGIVGNPYISPIYPYIVGVYGSLSPRIPMGTPNCPLIEAITCIWPKRSKRWGIALKGCPTRNTRMFLKMMVWLDTIVYTSPLNHHKHIQEEKPLKKQLTVDPCDIPWNSGWLRTRFLFHSLQTSHYWLVFHPFLEKKNAHIHQTQRCDMHFFSKKHVLAFLEESKTSLWGLTLALLAVLGNVGFALLLPGIGPDGDPVDVSELQDLMVITYNPYF